MTTVKLPAFSEVGIPWFEDRVVRRLLVDLQVGRHAGCTAFRTKDGRVEVGTLMGPTRRWRGESRLWGVHVKRGGLVMWWPLDGTVWVNV